MKCEIEFLAVGDASCAGDAIIVRYGDERLWELMLVDGGHAATGEKIVGHLKTYFGADVTLEHVVLTHSDGDHASGLRKVLEEVHVRNVWLHIPWFSADPTLFDSAWSAEGLQKAIQREYDIISEIVDLAHSQGSVLHYPFTGALIGPFFVCSPTLYAYQNLLPQFDKTPDPNEAVIRARNMWLGKESLAQRIFGAARTSVAGWTAEDWLDERLQDGGLTSASNESSVVLYGRFDQGNVLLTGDAGINALTWSANYLESQQLPLRQFSFVQVPHHGSRRNVGPTILNRVLGPIAEPGSVPHFSAFVSAPADDAKHPRRIVTNAFRRRGARVIATQGQDKIHYGGFGKRAGYVDVTPLPFFDIVEEYD
ncbi:hypothetical protein G7078_07785 [Sphingomonas sinipercae]|uniref:Metallo-beta-lactamase domain-containing protein n=1 Tax=Sphingomonas sinipercae TaxID=2714944 RepID=A0A6G7ZP41_9SPHN|nr:MBL fold metallo-hydrolase [Sphingomonas sinipercae]QIL02692.1 hypothetical protein G7078_07785 [Sphingomonas sinipercae]